MYLLIYSYTHEICASIILILTLICIQGVVTSVPSDAPDDYVALKELVDKPLWREKFGLTAEMVEPFAVVPIIGKIHQPIL